MRRTVRLLSLIGVLAAAAVAAARQLAAAHSPDDLESVVALPKVSQELRQALTRFEERFGT